jgi:hypothetical protein
LAETLATWLAQFSSREPAPAQFTPAALAFEPAVLLKLTVPVTKPVVAPAADAFAA